MLTARQLMEQIQKFSPFCCPHTYFPQRKFWQMQQIADELHMGYSEISDLRRSKFAVENIRCWRCRLKGVFHGL